MDFKISSFRFDVTPPPGHSCCGGWITPVKAVDDPLEAIGIILFGAGKPIVLCALDWTGLLNEAHVQWRRAFAEAAGTTPDRVAVQCVHQHNAPMACLEAEGIVAAHGDLPHIIDVDFFQRCLDGGRQAIERAAKKARALTHIACGEARVEKVASNRRVFRDDNGNVLTQRSSSCDDETLRALPEGLIDPWLKTVVFYDGEQKIASCHYYATHPMAYYGDGHVSSNFVGLARKRRQRDESNCVHLSFTGCAGNVAAGKYNDGAKEHRLLLTERIYDGIVRSETELLLEPVKQMTWKTAEILPPPRATLSAEALEEQIGDRDNSLQDRNLSAYMLSWLRRIEKKIPIVVSSLDINDVSLLHLPGEPFVQYQLLAQKSHPERFVATAGYGDDGAWYIPVKDEYAHGGYEVEMAFCDPDIDDILTGAIHSVLR